MVVVVALALVGTGLADLGAHLSDVAVERRIAGAELRARRGDFGDVTTEPETLGHLLAVAGARVGAVLTDLHGLVAVVDTLLRRPLELLAD